MALSANETTDLIEKSYSTIERLYLVGFPQIWTGRVNDASPARGVQKVIYDTGAIVSPFVYATDGVEAGLWVWFGSAAGDSDYGKARLIVDLPALVSGTMTVEWHDDIQLVNNAHITIVQVHIPAPKFSHFTVATSIHKDGPPASLGGAGEVYSDQNEDPPPDVLMGAPLVMRPTAAQLGVVTYRLYHKTFTRAMYGDGSGVLTLLTTILPETLGTPSAQIGWVEITPDTYGQGLIKLKATDTNGNISVGYRRVIFEDPTAEINIAQYSRGAISQAKGSYNIPLSLSMLSSDVDFDNVGGLGEVIITREDYFNGTAQYINDRDVMATDRENIAYAGYITAQSQEFGADGVGVVSLECSQAPMAMYLFSQSLTGTANNDVDEWYKMINNFMTTEYLSFHLLYYHSTLKEIIDIYHPRDDTILRAANDEWTEGDLMQRLASSVGEKGRLMDVTALPDGAMFIEPYLNLQDQTTRNAADTVMTLSQGHLSGRADASRLLIPRTSQVRAEGFSSPSGLLGDGVPYRSISGNLRLSHGQASEEYRGVVVESQTTLNYLTGRLLQLANDKITINATFHAGFWNVFSCGNQKWINTGTMLDSTYSANIAADSSLENLKMQAVRITHNPQIGGAGQIEVTFETEQPDGLAGRTVPIPGLTPAYVAENPLPPALVAPPTPDTIIATADSTNGFEIYNGSDWDQRNGPVSAADVINGFHLIPYWWRRAQSSNPDDSIWYFATSNGLYYTEDGGQTWQDRSPIVTSLPGLKTQADVIFLQVDSYPDRDAIGKTVWCIANVLNTATYTAYLFYSSDYGTNWSQDTFTTGARVLSVSANKETSTQAWIAWRDENDVFQVGQRDSVFATVGSDESFGAASNSEIDAGTRAIQIKKLL